MEPFTLAAAITDALRFWERGRIFYNALLAFIVILAFVQTWPASQARLSLGMAEALFILAVLANLLYCIIYPLDVFVQMSSMRSAWLKMRWLILLLGMLFAAIITRHLAALMVRAVF